MKNSSVGSSAKKACIRMKLQGSHEQLKVFILGLPMHKLDKK